MSQEVQFPPLQKMALVTLEKCHFWWGWVGMLSWEWDQVTLSLQLSPQLLASLEEMFGCTIGGF